VRLPASLPVITCDLWTPHAAMEPVAPPLCRGVLMRSGLLGRDQRPASGACLGTHTVPLERFMIG